MVAKRRNTPLVDMVDAMSAAALSTDEAFLDEMHPTALGVDSLAELIVSTVVDLGWPKTLLIPKTNHPFRSKLVDPWKGGPPGKLINP